MSAEDALQSQPAFTSAAWWKARLREIDWSIVLMILIIKALVLGFAVVSVETLFDKEPSWHEMWNRWDAEHYLRLAQNGYVPPPHKQHVSLVFYPLYPWLTRVAALLTRDYLAGAFVVSGLASIASGLLLLRLVALDFPASVARNAVWFLFIFPTSYFLHISYTESLFIALTLGCVLAARTDRWLLAGVLVALACLTRVNGLLLMPVLALEALQRLWLTRRIDWRWLWIGLGFLGFAGYLLLNYKLTGDFFAFSKIMEEHWFKKFAPPWIGVRDVWLRVLGVNLAEGFHEFFYIVLSFVCTVWCWIRLRPAYAVWMTLNWLLINSTSFVLSVPRYTLALFPIFILFAELGARRQWFYTLVTVWSLLSLAIFVSRFAQGTWAF